MSDVEVHIATLAGYNEAWDLLWQVLLDEPTDIPSPPPELGQMEARRDSGASTYR